MKFKGLIFGLQFLDQINILDVTNDIVQLFKKIVPYLFRKY